MNKLIILLLLISQFISAQVKGIVIDSISKKPISFVNIWVENENIGTTSEENGTFIINAAESNKNLIFSALGFEKRPYKIPVTNAKPISPSIDSIDETVLVKTVVPLEHTAVVPLKTPALGNVLTVITIELEV